MRKFTSRMISVCLGAIAVNIVACSNIGPSLEGTAWRLVSYNQEPVVAEPMITAEFMAGQLTGLAGCNRYFGSYTLTEGELTIEDTAATEKFCLAPEGIMAQEEAYLALIRQAQTYGVEGDALTISTSDGDLVFTVAEYVTGAKSSL